MAEVESASLEAALLAGACQFEDQGSSAKAHHLRLCVANLHAAWHGASGYEDPRFALVVLRDSAQSLFEAMSRVDGPHRQ